MRPFFFGPSSQALFGVYHPPKGGRTRRSGVVLCNPFGREYLRAHRSLRELAHRLCREGFHVLRFDYYGSGDSAGDGSEVRLDRWLGDIAAAVEEIQETSGSARVALVGLRLGATLATLAASVRGGVEDLVLWEPIRQGRAYLEELERTQAAWLQDRPHVRPSLPADRAVDEMLGFPFPEALRAGLEAIDLGKLEGRPARNILVVGTGTAAAEPEVFGGLDRVERRVLPGATVWLNEEGIDRALVPTPVLDSITGWLTGGRS